jgi:hypothetical protein
VQETLHLSPRLLGLPRTRWWLDGVRQAISWLAPCCLTTVWQTLNRWDLHYKRGRRYVHSPDEAYAAKVQWIKTITWSSHQAPQRIVQLYEDELTYYRRPTVAQDYAPAGADAPRAQQGWTSNTTRRIAACLDTHTGRLIAWQRAHFDRQTLLRFYQEVEAHYPKAEQIFLIHDNWPVHLHPDLLAGLRGSKLTLVALPTYAPWLNPVEKVWRKLYQEVLHLHPWVNAWEHLQATVQTWLEQWADGSSALLRYVGLCPT